MILDEAVHHTNTHLLTQEFEYAAPTSIPEVINLLTQYGDRARLISGGTYLLVQMKMEQIAPQCLIDIRHLPELTGFAFDNGVRIGANETIRVVRDEPVIQTIYTALSEACAAFGSMQIEIMGTLGGNVCNGSPASDTVPALLAFDAQLDLAGPEGQRVMALTDFLRGPGQTALRRSELLTAIRLPEPRSGTGSAFIKISRVIADLAKASVAAVIVREGDRIVECRLAFGSVAPTVMRAKRAEAFLIGKTFTSEVALEAGQIASEEIAPIDDVRSTAWYRREVAKALTHDVVQLAWRRAANSHRRSVVSQLHNNSRAPYLARRISHRVTADEDRQIQLTINGEKRRLWVKPNDLLINVLREKLELTGTKYGCGLGECGACTIHLNGQPALACLVLAVAADGSEVSTVEGLQGPNGELDPLQQAFIDHAAFQCGYCTPGMLMMTKALLAEIPAPSQDEIRDYLKVNRCRCTGFASIVRAVMSVAQPNGNGSKKT